MSRALVAAVLAPWSVAPAIAQWPQWGGPGRDFQAPAKGLAAEWPAKGPRKIWERALGEGFSSIIVDEGRLFTQYRSGEDESVIALDAATGETKWEHKYPAPLLDKLDTTGGKGPNSTPIAAGDKIVALGLCGRLSALDKKTGKPAWSHDLVKEYNAPPPQFGFSSSPIVYKDKLILPVGGKDHGIAAFALADGKLLWHKHNFTGVYSSPILIRVDGEDQLVLATADRVDGMNPDNADILWSEPMKNQGNMNIATPIWGPDQMLFVTSGQVGSMGLKLSKAGGATKVIKLWTNNKLEVTQSTVIRAGDYFVGSSGVMGPHFITAVHAATGQTAWQERGFAKANLVHADGKIVVLDDTGVLALATADAKGWKVLSKANMLGGRVYTAPTLVDATLYLRDSKKILALDLGK